MRSLRGRIVIAMEDAAQRGMVAAALRGAGGEVLEASSADDLRATIAASGPIDVVAFDPILLGATADALAAAAPGARVVPLAAPIEARRVLDRVADLLSPARGAHVLVVDDDALIRTLAAAFLEKLGCRSTMCPDGRCASAELARLAGAGAPVHLVLIDLRLGALSGVDVCRRLRAEGSDVAIICMSGDLASVEPAALDAAGFDGALAKPLSMEDLEACVALHAWQKHAPSRAP